MWVGASETGQEWRLLLPSEFIDFKWALKIFSAAFIKKTSTSLLKTVIFLLDFFLFYWKGGGEKKKVFFFSEMKSLQVLSQVSNTLCEPLKGEAAAYFFTTPCLYHDF